MKCNFILVKIKDKANTNLNKDKIQENFKLSIGNNLINFNNNKNKKEISNQNLEIIYNKVFIKKNIGKMVYETAEINKKIKILNEEFIANNMKRAKIIIKNKQYNLKENIKSEKQKFKVKIKFIDNIFKLNCMFGDCISLSSVYNFKI